MSDQTISDSTVASDANDVTRVHSSASSLRSDDLWTRSEGSINCGNITKVQPISRPVGSTVLCVLTTRTHKVDVFIDIRYAILPGQQLLYASSANLVWVIAEHGKARRFIAPAKRFVRPQKGEWNRWARAKFYRLCAIWAALMGLEPFQFDMERRSVTAGTTANFRSLEKHER